MQNCMRKENNCF